MTTAGSPHVVPDRVAVVGAGMVGLATAWRFSQRYPDRSILLLEKDAAVAEPGPAEDPLEP